MPRSRRGRGRGAPSPYAQMQQNPDAARQALEANTSLMPFIRGRQIDAGDLSGEVVEPIQATFGYFGKTFRVNPDLTETMVVDLLEAEVEIDDPNDPTQLVNAKDYVREHIHEDDFDEFWATAVKNRQGVQAIIKVCWKILEKVTDRPTPPPSDFSDGRQHTPTVSPVGVSEPVTASAPALPTTGNMQEIADHFIHKYEAQGRPDLAAQIALAAETRAARGLVTV